MKSFSVYDNNYRSNRDLNILCRIKRVHCNAYPLACLLGNASPHAQDVLLSRGSIDIRISADNSMFENGAQKIDCYFGCVASGPVLLKPNVVHVVLFNFWKRKFIEHGMVTLAIDLNGGSLFIFREKWPNNVNLLKSAPNSLSL